MGLWKKELTLEEINAYNKNSMIGYLKIKFTEITSSYLAATMPFNETTKQPFGILHGGASCVLAETVATAAGNLCIKEEDKICVGLDISMQHVRSLKAGDFVLCVAKPLHVGRSTHLWQVKNYNTNNDVIAVGYVRLMVINKTIIS